MARRRGHHRRWPRRILTVVPLKLPDELLDRSSAPTSATTRQAPFSASRASSNAGGMPSMALRWLAAGIIEANKKFRRLKAHKHLSVLRVALQAYRDRITSSPLPTSRTPGPTSRCQRLSVIKTTSLSIFPHPRFAAPLALAPSLGDRCRERQRRYFWIGAAATAGNAAIIG